MIMVLIMVNRVDRGDEIRGRTVSFPNVIGAPMIGRWKIPVDFLQLQIESVAELPEGVVYINYRCLVQSCLFSTRCTCFSEGKAQSDSTGTDNKLSRLCAFQAEFNDQAQSAAPEFQHQHWYLQSRGVISRHGTDDSPTEPHSPGINSVAFE